MNNVFVCGDKEWCKKITDLLYSTTDIKPYRFETDGDIALTVARRLLKHGSVFIYDMDNKGAYMFTLLGMAYAFDLAILGVRGFEECFDRNYQEESVYDQACEDYLDEDEITTTVEEYT